MYCVVCYLITRHDPVSGDDHPAVACQGLQRRPQCGDLALRVLRRPVLHPLQLVLAAAHRHPAAAALVVEVDRTLPDVRRAVPAAGQHELLGRVESDAVN